jgi:hypothetical protein
MLELLQNRPNVPTGLERVRTDYFESVDRAYGYVSHGASRNI